MSRKEKHSIFNKAVRAQQKRMNARIAGMAIAVVIVLVLGGVVFLDIIHNSNKMKTTEHNGIYFYVESAKFTNSSGSWIFNTTVKNTGTVFISLITITVPDTGSTVGTIPSIQVGQTASGTFAISGVTNGTLYTLEYYAVSGNLTYGSVYPVVQGLSHHNIAIRFSILYFSMIIICHATESYRLTL